VTTEREGRTGILGGTFDPIHLGHLDAADAARTALDLDEVWLVPSHLPPHRVAGPRASVYHRFAMTALAAETCRGLVASDLELRLSGPSYTSATLRRVADTGRQPWQLFFITGADAFEEIATWRDYPRILDDAHFVVVSRPGWPVTALRHRLPEVAPRMVALGAQAETVLARRGQTAVFLVEAKTTAVSSTAVRDRAARGDSLAGLVPAAVEAYIHRHALYSSIARAGDLHD
jgi:nicotinate-nucleotide adenylyltransferase